MEIIESFKMAIANLRASKMRSFLTMLGIIIGVASVMLIVGLGDGMKKYMTEEFESMGTNTLNLSIMGRGTSRAVDAEGMYEIVDKYPEHFAKMTPQVPMEAVVKIGNDNPDYTSVTGASEDYFEINDAQIEAGRQLQYADMVNRNKVCVVGSYLNKEWFEGNAVGKTLKLNGEQFTIVGTMAEKADGEERSNDNAIILPYTTATRLSANANISSYIISVVDENRATESRFVLEGELYEIFEDSNAYFVMSMAELLDMMNGMMDVQITILTMIAGVSLLVGGIGIMNIMLVSVSERTREIGIRKALGAKERFIMTQFVIEAATTSAVGGLIGIGAGYGFSAFVTSLIPKLLNMEMAVTPSPTSIVVAFGVSTAIGVLFGYLPAKKAAQLNPIDALRHD